MTVMIKSEGVSGLWEVGSYSPNGKWHLVKATYNMDEARWWCNHLNGGRM